MNIINWKIDFIMKYKIYNHGISPKNLTNKFDLEIIIRFKNFLNT